MGIKIIEPHIIMEVEPVRIFIMLGVFYLFMIFYQFFLEIKPDNENVAIIKETMKTVDESIPTSQLPIQKKIVQIVFSPLYFLEHSISYFGKAIFEFTYGFSMYIFNKIYNYLF
jgi:hypothetical protein